MHNINESVLMFTKFLEIIIVYDLQFDYTVKYVNEAKLYEHKKTAKKGMKNLTIIHISCRFFFVSANFVRLYGYIAVVVGESN